MNDTQRDFLCKARTEAVKACHPFPVMAACEAALESSWGNSALAKEGNNLFGMKQHAHQVYGTLTLPTREFENGQWVTVASATWVHYPDWASCFADRLATLKRLSSVYVHYRKALDAKDAGEFITEVSQTWSTDPNRAKKVLSIYQDYLAELAPEDKQNG